MDIITSESIISLFLSYASKVHHGKSTIKNARERIAAEMAAYQTQVACLYTRRRIAFYADAVANAKAARKTTFLTLLVDLSNDVREEARLMAVAHNEALIVNESYDETPECPNGNRLIHAVARVFGRAESLEWVRPAGVVNVRFDGDDGVIYGYDEDSNGSGTVAEFSGAAWHFVAWLEVKNPTVENLRAAIPKSAIEPWGRFSLQIGQRVYTGFTSAAAARDAYDQMRDDSCMGARDWPCGCSITDGKERVYLSYNGRAWRDKAHTEEVMLTLNTGGF